MSFNSYSDIQTMSEFEIDQVDGGARVGSAAAAAASAVVAVWVAAFGVGYQIGKDIGHVMFK
ncbi:hypothetical protein [Sphingorhabdus sp.]|uniref:hypothetical protein n=1 Tax=Sphingorhabdus sp. TaxID=1902408 RepID=UPI003919C122